ncbi:hypothetical protein GCM10010270_24250 [Streptomyces violaceus]|nr:hypothetical protein GCM10010270_24250 [Streptomyces janthinus]
MVMVRRIPDFPNRGSRVMPDRCPAQQLLARVRLSVAPLVHPLNPMLGRKRRARHVLALLDDCAREVRGLVAVAADPEASDDARLATACRRVEAAVQALTEGGDILVQPDGPSATEPVLARLHGLERALAELARPLRTPSGSPSVGA